MPLCSNLDYKNTKPVLIGSYMNYMKILFYITYIAFLLLLFLKYLYAEWKLIYLYVCNAIEYL